MSIRNRKGTSTSSNIRNSANSGKESSALRSSTQKSKPSGMKKGRILFIFLGFIVVIFVLSTTVSIIMAPSRRQCREVIYSFQTACNNESPAGIMNCLKPTMENAVLRIGAAAAGDIAMEAIMELLGIGVETLTGNPDIDVNQIFQTITVEPRRYGLPLKTRKVICKASFLGIVQNITFYITKYQGDAYIADVKF